MMQLHKVTIPAALAAVFSVTSVQFSSAAPAFFTMPTVTQSDVVQVRDGRRWRHRHYRGGLRYRNDLWIGGGAAIAGAIIGGAIANQRWYGGDYYDDPYYGDGYHRQGYYRERVYVVPRSSYRRGFNDGYRAGYRDGAGGGYSCVPRLRESGQC